MAALFRPRIHVYALSMRHPVTKLSSLPVLILALATSLTAVSKVHVVAFGKWTSVLWMAADVKPVNIKVRALIIDGRPREYTLGAPHDITERLFVVRRAFRINDSLPDDSTAKWQWERGGWLLVDRLTGRVSALNLPEFDAFYSDASWYRDYVAYCGVGDEGKKAYAVVAQISRRKPVLKKVVAEEVAEDASPDSICTAPAWQRSPVRVTFEPAGGAKQTFAIRGRVVDIVNDDEED